jgi:MFS-type transporter involved in bile tolerance (Atg22 family)
MIQVTFLTWMTDLNDENNLGLTNIPALWQQQVLITQCCAIPFVVIAGKLGDKLSGKIMVPGVLAW